MTSQGKRGLFSGLRVACGKLAPFLKHPPSSLPSPAESEDALLKMSVSQPETGAAVLPDFSSMTEDEQIAYAMQMSLQGAGGGTFKRGYANALPPLLALG